MLTPPLLQRQLPGTRFAPAAVRWRLAGPAALILAALVLWIYRDTAAAMVGIWERSETFAHAFLVPPIVVWLIWRRRAVLARMQPVPAPWMLLPMAAASVAWLLADLASVNSVAQLAFTALLVMVVPALLGWRIGRVLAFPLGFLFFAVPIGEFLMPQLMVRTADFTVGALQLSGVPVYREGQHFVIPSGSWSVVEACSGIRYLVASTMVGTLFAYLNYRSLRRRLAFVGVSIAVPVVANWIRAYGIVMLGHLSGNKLATGADHLIYGWAFFGIVITVMFLIGMRWREAEAAEAPQAAGARSAPGRPGWTWGVTAAAVAVLLLPDFALRLTDAQGAHAPLRLELPRAWGEGWAAASPTTAWRPAFQAPSAQVEGSYLSAGREVGLYVAYYRQQGHDRKLVNSQNVLVASNDKAWTQVAEGSRSLGGNPPLVVRSARIAPPPGLGSGTALVAYQFYWVDDRFTASDAWAKIETALSRLRGHGDDGAAVVVFTSANAADATDRLDAFVHDNLPRIGSWLRQTRDGGGDAP